MTDTLPAVITDLRMLPAFYYMMIQDGRIEELTEYINEDEEWKAMIEPAVLESCSEEDGSIYLGPISTAWAPMLIATAEAGFHRGRCSVYE